MRLCKDCRWSRMYWFSVDECHHPALGEREPHVDPVTGKTESAGHWSCAALRMHSSESCGYEGRLWERRP
jgi:hypothetical protein